MRTFQPSFSYWPPPRFRADSKRGFAAWILARDLRARRVPTAAPSIKRIVEKYHDSHARTIGPGR